MVRSLDGQVIDVPASLEILVYGSCVSRDLVALKAPRTNCAEYVARQSWISATSPGAQGSSGSLLTSSFQQRNLDGDLKSDALARIGQRAESVDALLLDLIDDRFGVYPHEDGFITPTAEFRQSGLKDSLALGDHIPFGTDRHLELWGTAASRMRDGLGDLIGRTYVLEAPFTGVSLDGSPVRDAMERDHESWNELYRPYYARLRELGFQVLALPAQYAVTTPHHRWGRAPFHYVESAYGWWHEQICGLLASVEPRGLS